MSALNNIAPTLVFAYGNPSRGDDALGPAMFNMLDRYRENNDKFDDFDLLVEYQLQVEHALDIEQRERVLFIDASASCIPPYELIQIEAKQDESYTTHAMSPASVLEVYQKITHQPPPPSYMITIRGYEFDLGQDISEQAMINLNSAYSFVKTLLATELSYWPRYTGMADTTLNEEVRT